MFKNINHNNHQKGLFYVQYENAKRLFFSPDDFFIAIDGLGLVLETCLNRHLKWHKNGTGVLLHAIYNLERTLAMLFKLKSHVKLVFFQQVDELIELYERQNLCDELSLIYHLAVWHLKSLEVLKGRVLFFSSFGDYVNYMKDERVVCYMGFSYIDANLIRNEEIAVVLHRHFMRAIQANLDMGVSVILTKNFWYDSSCANAFMVNKNNKYYSPLTKGELEEKASSKATMSSNLEALAKKISRECLYSEILNNCSSSPLSSFKYLFELHHKLLNSLSLDQRAAIGLSRVDVASLEQQHSDVNDMLQDFKLRMASLIRKINFVRTIEISPQEAAKIVDLFDSRLFWSTYDQISKCKGAISASWFENQLVRTNSNDNNHLNRKCVSPLTTKHMRLETELFLDFLPEFEFDQSANAQDLKKFISSKNLNRIFYGQDRLDEYNELVVQIQTPIQREATKFARYLENYAKSFQFQYNEPKIYDLLANQLEKPSINSKIVDEKKNKSSKPGGNQDKKNKINNADRIVEENKERKYNEAEKKDRELLKSIQEGLKSNQSIKSLVDLAKNNLKNCKTYKTKLEILKILLNLRLEWFRSVGNVDEKRQIALEYYEACESALRVFQDAESAGELESRFESDFREFILKGIEFKTSANNRLDFCNFQLTNAEFCLHRENFSKKDDRVADFKPDPWQIYLMDAIDRRKTVIVSAPTSSGKTFASFYAIKTVLKSNENDDAADAVDGVVIYVAPTKALLNQMMAGVYARFKDFQVARNKKLIGVFTRDHQENVFNSRVLLTVPECLEILYFSPSSHKEFIPKIKYIIFDEFQMINDEERGKVWERVVLMCQCPFLALSATIDDPIMLRDWLSTAKINKQQKSTPGRDFFVETFVLDTNDISTIFDDNNLRRDVNDNYHSSAFDQVEPMLIKCSSKFDGLNKHATMKTKLHKIRTALAQMNEFERRYVGSRINLELNDVILIEYKYPHTDFVYFTFNFNGEKNCTFGEKYEGDFSSQENQVLRRFSPLSVLNKKGKNLNNIVEGICLTPSDTHRLHNTLSQVNVDNVNGNDISKSVHFEGKSFIGRNQVRHLECDLKAKLLDVHRDDETKEAYNKLVNQLQQDSNFVQRPFNAESDLPILVEYLSKASMLPCLAFAFTRNQCERYTEILLDYFEKKEAYLRATKYAAKIDELKARREIEKTAKKKNRDQEISNYKINFKVKISNNELNDDETMTSNNYVIDYTLLDENLPECVLGERRAYSRDELNEQLERAFGDDHNDWRRRAILRGFAYHHAGINAKKRVCVESLFRNRLLQIVFCTSTLAQGIHVPCKTVIFLEDSMFLNSGLFKQCAGRAGRRGFDNHGSCIFLNIPEIRCKQLVSSKPSRIHPSFIISPTIVLKLFNLAGSKSSLPSVRQNVLDMLKNGLMMYLKGFEFIEMLNKYYLMFCTDLLVANSLLSLDGTPMGLHKFVTYFGYHEPSNLAMAHILTNIPENDDDNTTDDDYEHDLIVLLSHLFNRIFIYDVDKIRIEQKLYTWNSRVILDDLNESFCKLLNEFNQKTDVFFKKNLIEQSENLAHTQEQSYLLPFSKYNYMKSFTGDSAIVNEMLKIETSIEEVEHKTKLVSKFAALSGLNDEHEEFKIENKSVLVHMRDGFLDFQDLYPTLNIDTHQADFYGNRMYLNSYFADFYNHECYKSLLNENNLRDEVLYEGLIDFRKILRSLIEVQLGSARMRRVLTSINNKFMEKLNKADFDSTDRFKYRKQK